MRTAQRPHALTFSKQQATFNSKLHGLIYIFLSMKRFADVLFEGDPLIILFSGEFSAHSFQVMAMFFWNAIACKNTMSQ